MRTCSLTLGTEKVGTGAEAAILAPLVVMASYERPSKVRPEPAEACTPALLVGEREKEGRRRKREELRIS